MTSLEQLREHKARSVAAGPALWSAGVERRAHWLASALAELSPNGALFAAALAPVARSAGLSEAMVRWALESTLAPYSAEALLAWERAIPLPSPRAVRARPGALCVAVLAGNVFTAAIRAVVLPLLLGMPVLAKCAAQDGAFVEWLARALTRADPELAAAFGYVTFSSEDQTLARALFDGADTVVAYGSDSTLRAIRAELRGDVDFIGHGHGLGAAFIDRGALQDQASAARAAEALALDVAAYDQRGCMSPLLAWVTTGQPVGPEAFARQLFEALGALARELPRGPLPLDVAGAQLAFRGVAALRGTLLEGDGFAVAYEGDGPLRVSPGYRNLLLLDLPNAEALPQRLAPLSVHLRCLGLAGVRDVGRLLAALPARAAPRVCTVGRMQQPPLTALHDGLSAWEGLVRYTDSELA
ncbi:MAG TPA: acyl-CoA reductase [Polyangiales bacterium]